MGRTKILLVEDDPNWLKIFHSLVGKATENLFIYAEADNLEKALAAIQKENFGLILLDLMLPDSHALNTIEVMTTAVRNSPIIVLTTLDDEKLMQEAFQKGIDDYLVKDQYNKDTFVHVCRQAIRRFLFKQPLMENLHSIKVNLESLENLLEDWEKEQTN